VFLSITDVNKAVIDHRLRPQCGAQSVELLSAHVISVSLYTRAYLRNYTYDLHQIFVHVTYGRRSVLLWRRSDTLCTSGFIDDVILAYCIGSGRVGPVS